MEGWFLLWGGEYELERRLIRLMVGLWQKFMWGRGSKKDGGVSACNALSGC